MLGLSGHKAQGTRAGDWNPLTVHGPGPRYFPGFIECCLCDATISDICQDDP